MRSPYTPLIILSTQQLGIDKFINHTNHITLVSSLDLAKKPYLIAQGVYDGHSEMSIILENNPENELIAMEIANQFDQECILLTDNEGTGILKYLDGRDTVKLGSINVSGKKPDGDYTYVGNTGEYITFK